MDNKDKELSKFIDWLIEQSYQPIQDQIQFRMYDNDTIENKIRACFRGFEESYEELLERINHLEKQLS
jgi:hypothetical protein